MRFPDRIDAQTNLGQSECAQRGAKYNFMVASDLMLNPSFVLPPLPKGDFENVEMATVTRRKGSKRASLVPDHSPVALKSPAPVVPVDVGRQLQSAIDLVQRLKTEIENLKGAKSNAQKQVDLGLAKVEKLQMKLGSSEEVKKNSALISKSLKKFEEVMKGCASDVKSSVKASESTFSGASALVLGLTEVRSEVAELSVKLDRMEQSVQDVVARSLSSSNHREARNANTKVKPTLKAERSPSSSDDSPIVKHRKKGSEGGRRKSSNPSKKAHRRSSSESEVDRGRGRKERRIELLSSDDDCESSKKTSRKHRK